MINEVEEERGHIFIFWNEEIPQNPKTSKQQITSINKMDF
jgi:hypothetical protein